MVQVIDRAVLVGAFRKREREREGAVYVLLVLLFLYYNFFEKLNQINLPPGVGLLLNQVNPP